MQNNDLKEEIEICSFIQAYYDELPRYKSINGNTFTLTNIRAIVLHQNDKVQSVEEILEECKQKKINPYHFIIDNDGDIAQINPITECVSHCRSTKYTPFANKYFGDTVCPIFEDTPKSKHGESCADNCTVSILLPFGACNEKGDFNSNVYNALIRLSAYIINKYSKSLQGTSDIISAFEISEKFNDPKCFKDNAELYLKVKYDVEKLRSSWFIKFGGFKRGYPDERIIEIDKKLFNMYQNYKKTHPEENKTE